MKSEDISEKILDYLLKNPDAGGTLEDISSWWLESEKIQQAVEDVALSVETLIDKGIVERVVEGKNPVYKICKVFK